MTWTYSGSPGDSTKDAIRFLVGDTDTNNQLVTNEEIEYAVATYPKPASFPPYEAAAMVATTIAGKFSGKQSKTVGNLSIKYEEQYRKYTEMADRYSKIARDGIDGQGSTKFATPKLFGGGPTYLGPDDETNDIYST